MKILVTGANGQLGRCIRDVEGHGYEILYFSREELDITNATEVNRVLKEVHPDVVINCAAYVKTDAAEEKDKLLAYNVNALGPTILADACKGWIHLIHISTDYVFDGEKPTSYSTDDECNPLNIYGISKYCGERAIMAINPDAIIVRTAWLYSNYGDNFLTKTLKNIRSAKVENRILRYVQDQIGCPTYAGNLANFLINHLVRSIERSQPRKHNIYHYTDGGVASRYDFARAIEEEYGDRSESIIKTCEMADFQDKAKRPNCCVLSKKSVVDDFGDIIKDWRASLKACHYEDTEVAK